ncbi:ABC-2 type transport system permease protein [Paenibacillus tianmuensis]|uniref:ABC-2 type transport system permease protein n=1 Tax=Paenibacillus tianmuensis TaxID=624147 RepID=A0A1G4T5L6_9BACL|nr:ABC-2 family transporter protein [Paenibacillus tianmuensis]SCW75799.1 ABC-2 type transport system permease protein [Paenibacillus tianmuensis]
MNLSPKLLKYGAIGRISLRNHFAYVLDFIIRSIFLIIIMYIFIQLWQTTYRGEGSQLIAGYSFEQIIWYILFAEALTMAFPSLCTRVEEEVKSGDVGYKLTRPFSYIGYHYMAYVSEVTVRLLVNLAVGCALGLAFFGPPSFGWGWLGFFTMSLGAMTVNFMLNMALSLSAFWVEETRGLEFVYNKLLFTIGGMLMPLELFPEALQQVCRWLPFQVVLYFPAKTAVRWEEVHLAPMLSVQWAWVVVLALVVWLIYRKGVRKLNVNGG